MPSKSPNRVPRLLVVGNGMVGFKLLDLLTSKGCDAYELTVIGDEPTPAYDRVHLTDFWEHGDHERLLLAPRAWYDERGVRLLTGTRVTELDRAERVALTDDGQRFEWDRLVLATGSRAFVPPVSGTGLEGVYVYRTLEDLDAIASAASEVGIARVCVIGGGLLGLEAARAVADLGLHITVVELADRLMPAQLDVRGSEMLVDHVERLGIEIRLGHRVTALEPGTEGRRVATVRCQGQPPIPAELVIVAAGITPRDALARTSGLRVGPRGGVVVDDHLRSSDPRVYAIGEVACHRGRLYGLVAPGYAMARVAAEHLLGNEDCAFEGGDTSTRLKLLGVDVASFGDAFGERFRVESMAFQDFRRGVYKRLNLSLDGKRLLGGMLVGDLSGHGELLHLVDSQGLLPDDPASLILPRGSGEAPVGLAAMSADTPVCKCEQISKGQVCTAIREGGLTRMAEVKKATGAGSGCGGCVPMLGDLLAQELSDRGETVVEHLCEHFTYSRRDLFDLIRVQRLRTFGEVLARHGRGSGCEICKPTVASIIASLWNDLIVDHAAIQDTNDRFLANIQRGGTYSVIPRVPGGELKPAQLIALGQVAERYDLYTKITGGQRVALFGARVDELPEIWEALIAAGFESGHAYGKALRTVKSCVGEDWCRFGVDDSNGFAIRLEQRYKGIRAPHKLKSAVSGCIRECAEAQSKDFGLIAGERGWSLYVGGNGGARPRHGDLLASDLDEETAVRYLDRFLMYYIHTADKLTRTAAWLEKLPGGIERLREVVIDDALGLCAQLEADMARLVDSYQCEWRAVVEDPAKRRQFRHYANSEAPDESLRFIETRGQKRPAPWPAQPLEVRAEVPEEGDWLWVKLARAEEVPPDSGITVRYGPSQIAIYRFAGEGGWYASQNQCPHKEDMVLSRGLLGDECGRPKVACPHHKRTFDLDSGAGLNDPSLSIRTFAAKQVGDEVLVRLPPPQRLAQLPGMTATRSCDRPSA